MTYPRAKDDLIVATTAEKAAGMLLGQIERLKQFYAFQAEVMAAPAPIPPTITV